jgi:aminomuconate-semialdehyde dehydrogenase
MNDDKIITIHNFINNNDVPSESYIENINPSNGKLIAKIPNSGKIEADMAVEAASQAFRVWSQTSVQERSKYLNRIADEIELRIDEFAQAESQDQGKPLWLARNIEIPRAIQNFRFFASAILHMKNESTQNTQTKTFNYTTRIPIGVAVLISPWNLPLYLLSWKIAPCIASGCTCVCKPSEFTSITAYLLCECILKANVPPGVINIVFGYGYKIGNELVTHPNVNLISFTGGTITGNKIRKATFDSNKKLSFELGGKNAAIIFEDVNLTKYINDIGRSCFQNSGQICLCSSRVFVHRDIYDKFCKELVTYARSLAIGDPLKANTKLGPVVSKEHYDKIMSYIKRAKELGHKILCGETIDDKPEDLDPNGYFILPTIITDLTDSSPLMCEEIFGPVVCVTSFHDEDEVIERANGVKYGLAATVWTENLSKAHRVAQSLECGTTWINCFLIRDLNMPFGGMKDSGTGREGYPYSIDFFTELKTICVFHG